MASHSEDRSLSRLTDAVEAFLEHREDGGRDDESFLSQNDDLRDLLEAMIADENSGDGAEEAPSAELPAFLGDYRIVRELGRGGMGVVYEAIQVSLDRRVALKVLPAHLTLSPREIERFRHEASAIAKLQHPGIVQVHSIGSVDGAHFFAMDFVDGRTLHDAIEGYGASASFGVNDTSSRAAEAAEIAAHIAEALAYAHSSDVIHRDIKPQNILIDREGGVRLVDFGLAKKLSQGTRTNTALGAGTPYYMSPEQIDRPHDVDARSDVFSLGVVLYQMLCGGNLPFDGASTQQVIRAVTTQEIANLRGADASVPRDLETICLKALEKVPDHRYESAAELAADLRRFLAHEPIHARPTAATTRLAKLARRHRALTITLALLFLVATGASSCIWKQARDQQRSNAAHLEMSEDMILSLIDVVLNTTMPRRQGDEELCIERLENATTICETLIEKYGAKTSLELRRRFVDLLIYTGEFYRQRFDVQDAQHVHTKALQIATKNRREDPQSLASLSQWAIAFTHNCNHNEAEERPDLEEFNRSLVALEKLTTADDGRERSRRSLIAGMLSWRATMRLERYESLDSIKSDLKRADEIYSQLPRVIQRIQGVGWVLTRMHLANVAFLERNAAKALEIVDATAAEFERSLASDPERRSLRTEGAQIHSMRAKILAGTGRVREALRASAHAIEFREHLARDFPKASENYISLATEHIENAKRLRLLGRFERAIDSAREGLATIAHLAPSPSVRNARATARGTEAMLRMHELAKAKDPKKIDAKSASVVDSLYDTSLESRRALVREAPKSPKHRFSLAACACNYGSWALLRGQRDKALELCSEAFEYGLSLARRPDPSLRARKPNLRMQCHTLVTCLVALERPRDAFEVASRFLEAQSSEGIDFVIGAVQACRAARTMERMSKRDDEDRRLHDLYLETAMAWLTSCVENNPRVFLRNTKNAAFSVLRPRPAFHELVARARKEYAPTEASTK